MASVIANGMIDGQPIGDREAMSYYIIVATAGHDTTSSTAAGGLAAADRRTRSRWRSSKRDMSLVPNFVEESIRWVTPVKHFMRTAMQDYTLARQDDQRRRRRSACSIGRAIATRTRSRSRSSSRSTATCRKHVAFGYGVHVCLGMHLARMEIKALYNELLPRLKSIELNGTPKNTLANFVSGLKTLPVRYQMA